MLLPFCLSRFASRTWEGQGAPNSFGRLKSWSPRHHTPSNHLAKTPPIASHPDTPPTHISHTRTHFHNTHHHHHHHYHHHYHHHTTTQLASPERTATGDASAGGAHHKSRSEETKFRSTKKLGPSAETTLLHGAARTYQRCGQHECPSGSASCAWCGQTDIHRESSVSTRRKRAKNQEDERHRTTSTPVTIDPLSTSTVSCGNFPTSPSPSITTEQTHSHTAQAGAFHTLLAHAFHYTTQERSLHISNASPDRCTASHTPACESITSLHHLHKKCRDWSRVVRRSAKFLLLLLLQETLGYLDCYKKRHTRERESPQRRGGRGATVAAKQRLHSPQLCLCTLMKNHLPSTNGRREKVSDIHTCTA